MSTLFLSIVFEHIFHFCSAFFVRAIDMHEQKKVYSLRMFDSLTVFAPAKINLGLKVLPERGDGYHNIESIFTTVSLGDEIKVALTNLKNTCSVECEEMTLPRDNTFTAAYKAFCVLTGLNGGVSVKVTKRIPAGGGLGGGSSDASSFIQSIDTLFSTHLSAEALTSLAGKVGSDVYFFTKALLASKKSLAKSCFAAVVTGRGEVVRQIDCRTDYTVLLVLSGVMVSTKEAYALVDKSGAGRNGGEERLEEIYEKPVHEWSFANDFTAPVCAAFPKIREALDDVRKSGADFADMSGSGSTVFGIYEERRAAVQAQRTLNEKWKTVLATEAAL